MSRWGMGQPCMCGGCPDCLRAQGVSECPDCGAFGGCDCKDELPGLAKNVHTSPREPDEDFDDSDPDGIEF